jgi:hypothetical protein
MCPFPPPLSSEIEVYMNLCEPGFPKRAEGHWLHCKENTTYVFLFWELRGLSPNFHIHVSVSDSYIPRISPHTVFPCNRRGQSDPGNLSKIYECRSWETEHYNSVVEITVSFLGIHNGNQTRVRPFRSKNFLLLSEIKRNWIRFTRVSLVYYKISLQFFCFFSLIFAPNFLLRFTLVILASKRNKGKRNSSLFFCFFRF